MLKDQIISIKTETEQAKAAVEQKRDEAIKIHSEIGDYKTVAQQKHDEISQLKSKADTAIVDLENQSNIAISEAKKEFQELSNNAKSKLEESSKLLSATELEQKDFFDKAKAQHERLINEINLRLSPAATTNELTITFKEKVDGYKTSGDTWAKWFIAMTLFVMGIFAYDLFSNTTPLTQWVDVWLRLAPRLPLMGFAVWLVWFLANRRAEAKKLEESYKHKEVMARSYTGYRKAIEELDKNDAELLKIHMGNLLQSIKQDSSEFLTPNGERWPLLHLIAEAFSGQKKAKDEQDT